jgi:hypothetical protein
VVYTNGRYGFSLTVPEFMQPEPAPANGDGQAWVSADGQTTLVVSGANNVFAATTEEQVVSAFGRFRTSEYEITYEDLSGDPYAAVSGYVLPTREMIFYSLVAPGAGSTVSLEWSYPAADKTWMDGWLELSVATLSPGDLSQPH